MSPFSSISRHRKLLCALAAIAAGGYASYRIYTSSAFMEQRKRLLQMLSTLSVCCEAVSESAESISILSGDLKAFLLSDDDMIPQSLRQALKISHSEEFQETITVFSAALARGLRQGIQAKPRKEMHGHGHSSQLLKPSFQTWQGNDNDAGNEDASCREIREVSYTTKRQEQPRMHGPRERIPYLNVEKQGFNDQEWEIKSCSFGSDMHVHSSRRASVGFDKLKRAKPSEDLLEKLLSRLFSEPGVSFASTVTGSFARNLVLAFFDLYGKQGSSGRDPRSSSSLNPWHIRLQTEEECLPTYAKIMDVLLTNQCRMLVAECMQTFISTAVNVYVDKTKDINVYNDMVAGITNPSHKDSVKDMLTSVCNGAIETLVRTTYDIFRHGQHRTSDRHQQAGNAQWDIQEHSSLMARNMPLASLTVVDQEVGDNTSRGGLTSYKQYDTQATSCTDNLNILQGVSTGGLKSFIDGISRTLAIPSNRELIVDVAGTMSSEAVKSFVNTVVSMASSHLPTKMHGTWDLLRQRVSNLQGPELKERSRDIAAKAYVLASVCLAICLHVLSGSRVLQV